VGLSILPCGRSPYGSNTYSLQACCANIGQLYHAPIHTLLCLTEPTKIKTGRTFKPVLSGSSFTCEKSLPGKSRNEVGFIANPSEGWEDEEIDLADGRCIHTKNNYLKLHILVFHAAYKVETEVKQETLLTILHYAKNIAKTCESTVILAGDHNIRSLDRVIDKTTEFVRIVGVMGYFLFRGNPKTKISVDYICPSEPEFHLPTTRLEHTPIFAEIRFTARDVEVKET